SIQPQDIYAPNLSDLQLDDNIQDIINEINAEMERSNQRITPNIPVAFLEPNLVSRYKWLGKLIVPIRKFGARLFTKWYVDVFSSQQKHLNYDIWFGLNNAVQINRKQQKLIQFLISKNADQQNQIEKFEEKINNLENLINKESQALNDVN